MAKECTSCGAGECYRWYKGPLCANCYRRREYAKNPEPLKAVSRKYRSENPGNNAIACKQRYLRIVTERLTSGVQTRRNNKWDGFSKEERTKAIGQLWSKANRKRLNARDSRRRARELEACPKWVQLTDLLEVYSGCPPMHHVDHIIPLMHPSVCGLHVPWNLQVLRKRDNLVKGSSFDFTAMNDSWRSYGK